MSYYEEEQEDYDPDMFEEFGEGFEDELSEDSLNEKIYESAFDEASADAANSQALDVEEDDDYEFDEVVGGRDKKPVMSLLNKGKLSKYEMDDLLNLNE
ncbi:hypothetical protein JXA48_00685 [Candidatus Woesearchaeota archaeon]|nr:hypothetical protein [Candidatus Woesearchaeota archaeon]